MPGQKQLKDSNSVETASHHTSSGVTLISWYGQKTEQGCSPDVSGALADDVEGAEADKPAG